MAAHWEFALEIIAMSTTYACGIRLFIHVLTSTVVCEVKGLDK